MAGMKSVRGSSREYASGENKNKRDRDGTVKRVVRRVWRGVSTTPPFALSVISDAYAPEGCSMLFVFTRNVPGSSFGDKKKKKRRERGEKKGKPLSRAAELRDIRSQRVPAERVEQNRDEERADARCRK